jgi:hypothetical protein
MPWFKVDDNLFFHRKVIEAGNAALGLWVRAGSWSSCHLTDGFVPDEIARSLGSKAEADRLVRAGLWEQWPGGYWFHEWGERQPTKASVMAERIEARDRMRELRKGRRGE